MNVNTRGNAATIGLVSSLGSASAYANPSAAGPGGWHEGWGWGWGHMVFGSLMMLLVWIAVILAVVLAVRWIGGSRRGGESPAGEDAALAILKERFARGEIDAEEFEERKRRLAG